MASGPKKAKKPVKKVTIRDLKAKNAGAVKGGAAGKAGWDLTANKKV